MSSAFGKIVGLVRDRPTVRDYGAGMAGTAIGRLVATVGGAASLFLLTRLLSKAEIGNYGFALSMIQLLALLPSFGLERALLYRLARAEGGRPDELVEGGAVRQAALLTLAASLAVAFGLMAGAEPIGALSIEGAAFWIFWLAPSIGGIAVVGVLAAWFRARTRLATATLLPYTSEIARPLLFAVVAVLGLGAPSIAAAAVLAALMPVVLGACLVPRSAWGTSHRLGRADFVYGWKMLFARFTTQLTKRISVLLLGFFGSAAATGDFLIAAAIAVAADLGSEALLPAASPSLARRFKAGDRNGLAREYDLTRRIGLALALAVGCGYFLLGPFALAMFGNYASALPALLILWLSSTVQVGFGMNSAYLTMSGHPGRNLAAAGTSLVVQGLASIPLISAFGASGAAAALLLSVLTTNIVASVLIYRLHRFRCLDARSTAVLALAGATVLLVLLDVAPIWSGAVATLLGIALLIDGNDVPRIRALLKTP